MKTTTLFGYGDAIYVSEIALFRAEGVTADEAEPLTVPFPLPRQVWRVDGVDLFTDLDETLTALTSGFERMIAFTLAPDGRSYDPGAYQDLSPVAVQKHA